MPVPSPGLGLGRARFRLLLAAAPAPMPVPRPVPRPGLSLGRARFRLLLAAAAAPPAAPPPPAPDFWTALVAWASPRLPGLTGGLWACRAGEGSPLPYAEYDEGGATQEYESSGLSITTAESIAITVYAASRASAKSLAGSLRSVLRDAPLAFADGILHLLRPVGIDDTTLDPDPGPGGGPVYASAVTFRAIIERT